MTDLVAAIRAAIDETEQIAQDAGGLSWSRTRDYDEGYVEDSDGETVVYDEGRPSGSQAEHIARHDPASVLRRCAADREIIGWCESVIGDSDMSRYGEFGALADHPDAKAVTLAMETLLNLARGLGVEP